MSDTLRVDSYTVNDIFVNYVSDKFFVNRKYQRKLVWEIKEKRLLIDSILKGIPLPAILIAQFKQTADGSEILEIVDGMQRLNAIVSFLLGEFSVDYDGKKCYFDASAYAETFPLLRDGKLKEHADVLPKNVCQEFYRYQIPAIITGQDDDTIKLIFGRINSTGRKISSHDMRQSMSVGRFPDLVRRIASHVRKDFTFDDRVNLADMPKVSVGPICFGYGVDQDTVFWRRHDLITPSDIKASKDEEIIETLIAAVLLGNDFVKSKTRLDALYEEGSSLNKKIEQKMSEFDNGVLETKFVKVFDTFDMVFDSIESDFSSSMFSRKKVSNKDECFKILFLALYRLLDEDYVIHDYARVAGAIKDAADILNAFTKRGKVDYQKANKAVVNLYQLLKSVFLKQVPKRHSKLEIELDKRLSYSKIELQMTEFKIGISDYRAAEFNYNCIHAITRTLVAMSNTNNVNEIGYVLIGVADSSSAYEKWYQIFKEKAVIINQHYVPGVACEAEKIYGKSHKASEDSYLQALQKALSKEPVNVQLKNFILENIELIDYHGVDVVVLKSKNVGVVSTYDGCVYVRHGGDTIKVEQGA